MDKAHKAFGAMLVVLSVAVSGLCYAAWRPVTPAIVEALQSVQPRKSTPEVLTVSTVLISAPWPKEAGKPRPVAAKAKVWGCGERIVMDVGPKVRASEPSSVRSCGWR